MAYIAKFVNQTYDTLAQDKWIAGSVKMGTRAHKIPFRHYREIASIFSRRRENRQTSRIIISTR